MEKDEMFEQRVWERYCYYRNEHYSKEDSYEYALADVNYFGLARM